ARTMGKRLRRFWRRFPRIASASRIGVCCSIRIPCRRGHLFRRGILRRKAMAENDFFIGWKPMPRRLAPVVGVAAGVFVLTGGVLAVVRASAQPSRGGGVGEDELRAFEGQALVEPYAMLRTTDESGKVRTILLVDEGKFGAADRLRPFAGQTV